MLRQLGLILTFGFLGEIISHYLPLGMPASVLGMVLMLIALGIRLLKPEHLGETADYLSANMGFFFLPFAATILGNYGYIRPVVVPLILIVIISTIVTFFATYGTVWLSRRVLSKQG
jgi:holin-like protein